MKRFSESTTYVPKSNSIYLHLVGVLANNELFALSLWFSCCLSEPISFPEIPFWLHMESIKKISSIDNESYDLRNHQPCSSR